MTDIQVYDNFARDENGGMITSVSMPATADLNEILAATSLIWADPADNAANTAKTQIVAAPTNLATVYALTVSNPSTESDISVQVFTTETLMIAGTPRTTAQSLLTTVNIPKAQTVLGATVNTYTKLLSGLFAGGKALLLRLSNDTNLTVEVTVDIRLSEAQRN